MLSAWLTQLNNFKMFLLLMLVYDNKSCDALEASRGAWRCEWRRSTGLCSGHWRSTVRQTLHLENWTQTLAGAWGGSSARTIGNVIEMHMWQGCVVGLGVLGIKVARISMQEHGDPEAQAVLCGVGWVHLLESSAGLTPTPALNRGLDLHRDLHRVLGHWEFVGQKLHTDS